MPVVKPKLDNAHQASVDELLHQGVASVSQMAHSLCLSFMQHFDRWHALCQVCVAYLTDGTARMTGRQSVRSMLSSTC